MDLSERLSKVITVNPTAGAISQDGRWDSWADIAAIGSSLSERTRALPEDAFVALISRNDSATISALLWGLTVGRPVLLLNHMQPDAALSEEIAELRPAAVVAAGTDWDRPGVLEATTSIGATALRLERGPNASAILLADGTEHAAVDRARPSGTDCAVSLKTSGTTGKPKRVEVTRSSLSASIDAVDRHHNKGSAANGVQLRRGATIQMLPLAHTSAIQSICVTIAAGRQLVLLDRFEPVAWAEAVRDHDVVTTGVPPAGLRMILDADIDPAWLSGLRSARSGSAPLDPDLAEEFEKRYDVAVLQAYGATELQGLASWTLKDHERLRKVKRGAVGRLHPGVEVRVVDAESLEALPVGATGLLEVRTAQASSTDDSWIRTSDLAYYDTDGFLWIVGRADGAINRGGFKVDAGEVADELRAHPSVLDAVVVGIPDPRLGQVPVAAVQTARGAASPTEAELRTWLRDRVEAYKVPTAIRVLAELPRTVAMKPDAQAVRTMFADQTALDAV
ncbi:fatty acid--CoA ligase family protein [Rhodococcus sp. T2V]|uniref:class I adenylate-forming enzyme family protein n=1 Tax=Rhodococcus sp. T2V TaxID=3034164 RepID=UPI0023E0ED19|nr:fatty acid--CoA ligase family protein [Rhodococcus sp. T2V]MDF3310051.1 fatty acid--CoA ligase family protein [Rhodococcus sp. T2V]